MIGFIEFIVGIAVVLVAGYLIAQHRERIRGIANATMLGIGAGSTLSNPSGDSDNDHRHDRDSHPSGSHSDGVDSSSHDSDSI